MDDDTQVADNLSISGEWWWLAGVAVAAAAATHTLFQIEEPENDGVTLRLSQLGQPLGTLTLKGSGGATTVHYETDMAHASYWEDIIDALHRAARTAQRLRRGAWGATPENIIEHYYRSRAAGSNVTLGELAEQTGFSEKYLRKRKVAYDKAGKWGSKRSKG